MKRKKEICKSDRKLIKIDNMEENERYSIQVEKKEEK